jgi:hypothetical protein
MNREFSELYKLTNLAISSSRRNAWDAWSSRKHSIQRVYQRDEKAEDLLLLGKLAATFPNGTAAVGEFSARIVIEFSGNEARFKSYEVWAVSSLNSASFSSNVAAGFYAVSCIYESVIEPAGLLALALT